MAHLTRDAPPPESPLVLMQASTAAVNRLIEYDLAQLNTSYVDLLLIHTPRFCNASATVTGTWAAMDAARRAGRARSIGVSNFLPADLQDLYPAPAVNQIMLHVGAVDRATVKFCAEHNITVEAYSPMGRCYPTSPTHCLEAMINPGHQSTTRSGCPSVTGHPDGGGKPVYELPEVVKIAKAHGRTGAQVALRWIVQQGFSFVTASGLSAYDSEDLAIWDFALTANEMAELGAVTAGGGAALAA